MENSAPQIVEVVSRIQSSALSAEAENEALQNQLAKTSTNFNPESNEESKSRTNNNGSKMHIFHNNTLSSDSNGKFFVVGRESSEKSANKVSKRASLEQKDYDADWENITLPRERSASFLI